MIIFLITRFDLGVTMRVGPTRLGLARIRPEQRGLACPTPHILCRLKTLARPAYSLACGLAGRPTFFLIIFYFIFMIKLSMFKNWKTLRSSQN